MEEPEKKEIENNIQTAEAEAAEKSGKSEQDITRAENLNRI